MRRVFLIAILVMIPGVAWAGGGGGSSLCPAYSSGTTISMLDSCFNGVAHSAPVGQTLTVSNDGFVTHTLTSVEGSFDTGNVGPGQTAQLSFDEAGIYKVFCALHGSVDGSGMAGVLIVGEPDPTFVAAPVDPAQVKADVSEAVADGNRSLTATIDGHERLLTGLVSGQTDLGEKIDQFGAAKAEPAETAAPIVVTVPSQGYELPLLAAIGGLLAGLALATFLGVVLTRRLRGDNAVLEVHRVGHEPIATPGEAPLEHDLDEPRVLVAG